VLVGRGAQSVLAQRHDALHVYVVASKPWRMKLAVERLGADPAKAEKVVDDFDRQRDQYVRTYYDRTRHDPANYDLVLNAERLGFEGAAKLIVTEGEAAGVEVGVRMPCPYAVRSSGTRHAASATPSTQSKPPAPTASGAP